MGDEKTGRVGVTSLRHQPSRPCLFPPPPLPSNQFDEWRRRASVRLGSRFKLEDRARGKGERASSLIYWVLTFFVQSTYCQPDPPTALDPFLHCLTDTVLQQVDVLNRPACLALGVSRPWTGARQKGSWHGCPSFGMFIGVCDYLHLDNSHCIVMNPNIQTPHPD